MMIFFIMFLIAPCAGLLLFIGVRKNLNYTIVALLGIQVTIIGGIACLVVQGSFGPLVGFIIIFTGFLITLTSVIATSGEK